MDLIKLNKKIIGITLALIMAVPAFASIGVSPTKIEINANKIKTNYATTAIEVRGSSTQPVRYKAYTNYFIIDEKGEMVVMDKSDDPHDLSKKLRFVPSEFTVAAGKSQKVRLNIAGVNTLPDGESRAVLYLEDINPKEINIPTGQSGIGAQLIVKTRVGVPIYVDKGKVLKVGEIEYFNVTKEDGKYYINMKVLSKGNSKIRYNTQIQIIQGKKLIDEYNLSERVVADNNSYTSKVKLKTDKITNNGEYIVRVVLSYLDGNGKKVNIKKETNINIPGNV